MPPIIPSAFPSTGRVPSPSIEIENSRMEKTISPNTFTRPSCEREPRRKTISIWPSRKFHRCALYHELVSFRSVFFPFLSLSPYTLLFPTTTKREIAASTRTFKLAAIRFLSHGLHLLTPRVPRFFSLFFLSGGHFSFIFGANQEPTLDLVADTVFAEWSERRVLASRVGNTVSGNWSELRYCGGNCAVHWRAIRIRHRYIKVGQF